MNYRRGLLPRAASGVKQGFSDVEAYREALKGGLEPGMDVRAQGRIPLGESGAMLIYYNTSPGQIHYDVVVDEPESRKRAVRELRSFQRFLKALKAGQPSAKTSKAQSPTLPQGSAPNLEERPFPWETLLPALFFQPSSESAVGTTTSKAASIPVLWLFFPKHIEIEDPANPPAGPA